MKRTIALLLALTLVFALFAGCAKESTDTPNANKAQPADAAAAEKAGDAGNPAASAVADKVVVGITNDIPSLAPFYGVSMGGLLTQGYFFEYLFYADNFGGEIKPVIGKNYTVADDYSYVDIEIFDYVYDSAGNHITADDVVFSYETALATGNYSGVFKYITSFEKTGDYTIRFYLQNVNLSTLETVFANQVFIVSKDAYDETAFATKPIGTGAYVVEDFIPSSSLTLVKNDNYWQTDEQYRHSSTAANVKRIECRIILESAQVAIALENKDIDIASSTSSEDVTTYFLNNDDFTVGTHLSNRFQCLAFSLAGSSPVSNDLKLRQAILYAINSEEVMYGVVGEYGQPCRTTGMDSGFSDFNPDWYTEDYYDFDLDKAQQLLNESDYAANGSPTLRIILENSAEKQRIAQIIQGMLLKIGISTEINTYDSALFTTYKYEYDEWDLCLDNYAITQAQMGTIFSGFSFDAGLEPGQTPYNLRSGHTDAEFDELCSKACSIETWSNENVNAAHQYLKEHAYFYGLFTAEEFNVAQSGITQIGLDKRNFVNVSTSVYAPDYKSVVDK